MYIDALQNVLLRDDLQKGVFLVMGSPSSEIGSIVRNILPQDIVFTKARTNLSISHLISCMQENQNKTIVLDTGYFFEDHGLLRNDASRLAKILAGVKNELVSDGDSSFEFTGRLVIVSYGLAKMAKSVLLECRMLQYTKR